MKNQSLYQRVQTATPQQRLRIKHQGTMLKQIKTLQVLEQLDNQSRSSHSRAVSSTSNRRSTKKRKLRHYNSTLQYELAEIQKIRGKQPKPKFSFSKDQNKICRDGWAEFGEKLERKTESQLKNIRKKANFMLNRATVSNICIINGVKKVDQFAENSLPDQKINNLWKVVYGKEVEQSNYFKVSQLSKDIKNSVVLGNAYKMCLHSKSYNSSTEEDLVDQKFKSFVYINENANKLTKKKMDTLLKNNFLIQ